MKEADFFECLNPDEMIEFLKQKDVENFEKRIRGLKEKTRIDTSKIVSKDLNSENFGKMITKTIVDPDLIKADGDK